MFKVLSSEAGGPTRPPPALGPWHFATHAILQLRHCTQVVKFPDFSLFGISVHFILKRKDKIKTVQTVGNPSCEEKKYFFSVLFVGESNQSTTGLKDVKHLSQQQKNMKPLQPILRMM